MNEDDFKACSSSLETYLNELDNNLFDGQIFRSVNLFCRLDGDKQFRCADLMVKVTKTDSPQDFEFWIIANALDFFEKNGCITADEKIVHLKDLCQKMNIELPKIYLKLQDLCADVIRGPGFFNNKRITGKDSEILKNFGIDVVANTEEETVNNLTK